MKQNIKSLLITLVAVVLGFGMALAGSYGVHYFVGVLPLYAFCVLLAFAINWVVFVPSFIWQTEKFFDLTGSISYIVVIVVSVFLSHEQDMRSLIILVLVSVWALRLGSFLFARILRDGKDGRFDTLKVNFARYLSVWTLQGLWITFTVSAALAATTTSQKTPLDSFAFIGIIVWVLGFAIEVIADAQKWKWRKNPKNKGKFINIGLWRKSRHPNYFGEITLWTGMAIIAFPTLQAWQLVTLISPVFVAFLLIKVSGIPMLEQRANHKWGGQEDYETYKKNTPVLIPKPKL